LSDYLSKPLINEGVLDCILKTNNHTFTTLKVRAIDSNGLSADTEFIIGTFHLI